MLEKSGDESIATIEHSSLHDFRNCCPMIEDLKMLHAKQAENACLILETPTCSLRRISSMPGGDHLKRSMKPMRGSTAHSRQTKRRTSRRSLSVGELDVVAAEFAVDAEAAVAVVAADAFELLAERAAAETADVVAASSRFSSFCKQQTSRVSG